MNAKIKPQANTANPCPYCASPDLFNEALALPKLRSIVTEKNLPERLKGFTVQILWTETKENLWHPLPPLFFSYTHESTPDKKSWQHGVYFACRFTHKSNPIIVDMHWWEPPHGRIVTLRGIPDAGASSQDLKLINEVLKLLRAEARGAPKIDKVELIEAIQKQGAKATQSEVATELGVAAKSLQRWARRNGFQTWEEVKRNYAQMRIF